MWRLIGGIIAGAVAWFVVVTILDRRLRYGWHDYPAVEKAMTFTLPMMIARLTESGISSIAGGVVAALVGSDRFRPPLGAGVLLAALFAPEHYLLWHRFPVWYHLTFLISLVVLSLLGGRLVAARHARLESASS